jgi:tRNA 2-thiouridine synthesizing protein A
MTVPGRSGEPAPGARGLRDEAPDCIDIDLSGLKCPLPVLRTRKALRALRPGQTLAVTCTDPLAMIDIPNLVREEGARLDAAERLGDTLRFRMTVSAKPPYS